MLIAPSLSGSYKSNESFGTRPPALGGLCKGTQACPVFGALNPFCHRTCESGNLLPCLQTCESIVRQRSVGVAGLGTLAAPSCPQAQPAIFARQPS